MRSLRLACAAVPLVAGWSASAQTFPIPAGNITVQLEPLSTTAGGFSGPPIDFAHANDGTGRLFIAGQGSSGTATVRLFKNNAYSTFLSVGGLNTSGERGLLGMAFHPDYANPASPGHRKFYTYTSEAHQTSGFDFSHPELGTAGNHDSVVREWTASATNPDVIDTSVGSRILMRIVQPQSNHNGGAMKFGPDGYLYVALGDGGGGNDNDGGVNAPTDGHTNGTGNAQDITNVYGKILRIDPIRPSDTPTSPNPPSANNRYRIPADNPFVGTTGVDEIFAHGLRNPFRMSFDRGTGKLYLGDVGQGVREEVNIIEKGKNYGWVYMEGTRVNRSGGPAGMVAPIAEYVNRNSNAQGLDGNAVIGGFVYRGPNAALHGKYIFGDLAGKSSVNRGRIFWTEASGGTIREFLYDAGGSQITGNLYSFGEAPNGDIHALFTSGGILRIEGPQWRRDGSGSWGDAANWIGNVPDGVSAPVSFLGKLRTPANGPAVITLDGARTAGHIAFSNTVTNGVGLLSYEIQEGTGGTLTLNNAVGTVPAMIKVHAGHHAISAPVMVQNNLELSVVGGSSLALNRRVELSGANPIWRKIGTGALTAVEVDLGASGLLAVDEGTIDVQNLGSTSRQGSVEISAGASASVGTLRVDRLTLRGAASLKPSGDGDAPAFSGTARVNELALQGAGKLDIANNGLVVSTNGAARLGALREAIVAGRGSVGGVVSGAWNGVRGITSSAAAAKYSEDQKEDRSVGYALNGDIGTGGYSGQFMGVAVTDDSLLVRYTRTGDANLDGVVNNNDVTILAGHYRPGVGGRHWYQADLNYDGVVDNNDITILAGYYNPGAARLGPAAIVAVPEPGVGVVSVGTALGALLVRRRRA